ncbi:MAG: ABC transporter ATP-binding protein [Bacteroidetes bacterium]|nr:ABC transporter ATP-binding protein [Bacteroidota bacterium]HET6244699.1 ABC transporter ATP-binding protein [Bacteroidia bacterium]
MKTVIKVENVSKQYRLGNIGTGTLAHDFSRWWAKIKGKEDPFLKVGQANVTSEKADSEYVWALENINFTVKKGEILGIIGKNGAGKSTLLKILSRVTHPTMGQIKIKGRIASLLEVGTGFHPELTGKENIFLNGAILGMSKIEIKRKFDEIVEFSGVERYIDTPVKRYSSGMRVRLAFSVAAHLEPEILIIDEVLAVGDADFQKKCLGKMDEVAKQGRTVLFVSHQLGMVKTLCTRALLLREGRLVFEGDTEAVIEQYLSDAFNQVTDKPVVEFPLEKELIAQVKKARILNLNAEPTLVFDVFDSVRLELEYIIRQNLQSVSCIIDVERNGELLFSSFDTDRNPELLSTRLPGIYTATVNLPTPLKAGVYTISVRISRTNVGTIFASKNIFKFTIEERSFDASLKSYASKRNGKIVADLPWDVIEFIPSEEFVN